MSWMVPLWEVRGDEHRDAEDRADPADQAQHVVTAGGVEAVGGLVQEDQARVVHQRLSEFDPLAHTGRVAADRPVPLLVQPDVAQRVGGPLPRSRRGEPGHACQVYDQLRR